MDTVQKVTLPPSIQPEFESGVDGNGISDNEAKLNPNVLTDIGNPYTVSVKTLAYGQSNSVLDIAYGGNSMQQTLSTQSARINRLQRGIPKQRRGKLVPAVPRTKAQTIYTRDPGQTLVTQTIQPKQSGVANPIVPESGSTNLPNPQTGAVNRYRTDYVTQTQFPNIE